jgi:hypothetical protein
MADTDHILKLRYSTDRGQNWSNWKERSLGATGEYEVRPRYMRLGRKRNWIFEFTTSSARKTDVLGAVLTPEQTDD